MPPRLYRVSDAEREYVVGILQKATGKGLIDLDGFSERADTAYSARTRQELNAVLSDLPGLVHRDAPPARVSIAPERDSGIPRTLELTAHHSNLIRNGQWYVPERVVVRARHGSTKLDFTEARIDSPEVHLELDTKWGTILIIVPEHVAVDVNGITEVKHSSVEDRTRSAGRSPRLVLSGRVHGGTLKIRHPKRHWWQ
ncbi:DUF1707 domain-containing protein [Haloechinothrix sp. LS1_15]|nr:DUF1707 domain-containing protein [Haloechinothrix sp. LS1_15]